MQALPNRVKQLSEELDGVCHQSSSMHRGRVKGSGADNDGAKAKTDPIDTCRAMATELVTDMMRSVAKEGTFGV